MNFQLLLGEITFKTSTYSRCFMTPVCCSQKKHMQKRRQKRTKNANYKKMVKKSAKSALLKKNEHFYVRPTEKLEKCSKVLTFCLEMPIFAPIWGFWVKKRGFGDFRRLSGSYVYYPTIRATGAEEKFLGGLSSYEAEKWSTCFKKKKLSGSAK